LLWDIRYLADVFDRAPLAAEVPHRGASWTYRGGNRCPIEAPHRGAP